MFRLSGTKMKVLNPIIKPVMIKVMYILFGIKVSPQMLFHYKPMLYYLSLFGRKGMIGLVNIKIAISEYFTTSPKIVIFSAISPSITRFATKSSPTIRSWFKLLLTNFTSRHGYSIGVGQANVNTHDICF